jgi:hypothetical protein
VGSQLATRDVAIASKASSVELTSELTTRDTTIATKASTVELASQLATVNTALDSKASSTEVVEELALIDTAIAAKASSVTLASELATRDTAIAGKASTAELASQLATRDTAIAAKASSVELTSELTTRDSAIAAIELALAQREAAFTATAPLQKVISGEGIALRINPTADVVANAFINGKFRLHSPDPTGVEVQRFDDDGAFQTDGWRQVCKFAWDDVDGGSLRINALRAVDANHVTCADNLHITGNLSVDGPTPSQYWAAGTFSAAGVMLHSAGKVGCAVTRQSTGVYLIQFTSPHPNPNFIVSCSCVTGRGWGGYTISGFERDDSSGFWIVMRASSSAKVDVEGTFVVLA